MIRKVLNWLPVCRYSIRRIAVDTPRFPMRIVGTEYRSDKSAINALGQAVGRLKANCPGGIRWIVHIGIQTEGEGFAVTSQAWLLLLTDMRSLRMRKSVEANRVDRRRTPDVMFTSMTGNSATPRAAIPIVSTVATSDGFYGTLRYV
ncbi:MAG: hypothetical protein OXF74_05120 [Rhodobacteraceae bacterium]|nr:hypothetical protein [Paracoccaceae bacterium]